MQQKLITVTLEPDGTSKIDLAGFTDKACGKVMDDFRGGDRVLSERRKPEYYNHGRGQQLQQGNQ
jgi:hypothetical protein